MKNHYNDQIEMQLDTKTSCRPQHTQQNKLNILRRFKKNLLDDSQLHPPHNSNSHPMDSDIIILMDNFVCRLFDITVLNDSYLPKYESNFTINNSNCAFSNCKHAFDIISQQTRAADELASIIKVCKKCNAIFVQKH
ncbi:GSCOCT00012774001.2-RA-CDS [Cotesia congregata]|uniref:Cc_lef5 n=1 Tax=Cotesia congregata TaxID=51543 RepID=B9W4W1_COTCN|nr:GSCOCT00012774001.2-RA-CDS [Cotesia congregata]CAG5109367.1 Cc_lef5 [Cotesia congregata]CAT00573.1 putative transcription initiation factor LEF-5 [Cotesia congregata]